MKRHRFDPVSLIWGVFFTGFAVVFLTDAFQPTLVRLRAFPPLAVVALGLAILSSIRRPAAKRDPGDEEPPGSV